MALVGIIFCAPLFTTLDRRDFENDEAIYAFSTQTMVRHGDWLIPKSIPNESEPWLEKPPLKFWIVGLPMRWGLLPANEFGFRFWDALMASVGFLYVLAIGRRIAGPICGLVAVFLLFIHDPLVLDHGLRTNNMEATLFLAYAAAAYHFLAWRSSAPDNRSHLVAISLFFVLAFMTKFVAALFLPIMLGLTALLTPQDRERVWLNRRGLLGSASLALALIAPWFIYVYARFGSELFDTMFGTHIVQRLTSTLDPRHLQPWHYYFSELWRQLQADGVGWLAIAGGALLIFSTIRRRWTEGALVVIWFVVPMLLMSFGTSKLYHYAYPFLAPAAIAGGFAAAKFAQWLWRGFERPAHALVAKRRFPTAVQTAATIVGLILLVVTIATALVDRVRIAIGDNVLLRNDSVVRPAVIWAAAWIVGAPKALVQSIVPCALLLVALPLSAYGTVVDRMNSIDRPVHNVSSCLRDVVARGAAEGRTPPGVWMATPYLHKYAFYMHDLGPWEIANAISAETVDSHLSSPNYRPVLLSRSQLNQLKSALSGENHARIGSFEHEEMVLLLPGPYASCAVRR